MDGTVANARLLSLTIERFKSYKEATTIELSPLTVILGRNNSGKSSIIQALLLLKQTLAHPRPEVPLFLMSMPSICERLHMADQRLALRSRGLGSGSAGAPNVFMRQRRRRLRERPD